jgi:hypothetical protein
MPEDVFPRKRGDDRRSLEKSVLVIKPTYMKHTDSFCCALLPKNHTPTCLVSQEDLLKKLSNLAFVYRDLIVIS